MSVANESWHLNKQVPIALIAAIAMQTVGVVWWAAGINNRVEALEEKNRTDRAISERVSVIEEKVSTLKETSSRIEDKLDVLIGQKRR